MGLLFLLVHILLLEKHIFFFLPSFLKLKEKGAPFLVTGAASAVLFGHGATL